MSYSQPVIEHIVEITRHKTDPPARGFDGFFDMFTSWCCMGRPDKIYKERGKKYETYTYRHLLRIVDKAVDQTISDPVNVAPNIIEEQYFIALDEKFHNFLSETNKEAIAKMEDTLSNAGDHAVDVASITIIRESSFDIYETIRHKTVFDFEEQGSAENEEFFKEMYWHTVESAISNQMEVNGTYVAPDTDLSATPVKLVVRLQEREKARRSKVNRRSQKQGENTPEEHKQKEGNSPGSLSQGHDLNHSDDFLIPDNLVSYDLPDEIAPSKAKEETDKGDNTFKENGMKTETSEEVTKIHSRSPSKKEKTSNENSKEDDADNTLNNGAAEENQVKDTSAEKGSEKAKEEITSLNSSGQEETAVVTSNPSIDDANRPKNKARRSKKK